ncbi:MAG: uroporphyrinogen-III synthase [Propionibacteriaceae bacterium]|nr:uroporphyrinogen-III synthase [Propionibacteriaceae bacterium]
MTSVPVPPWCVVAHTRRDLALAEAVSAAGGVLDETELIRRRELPADEVAAAMDRAGHVDWIVVSSPFTVDALRHAGIDLGRWLERGAKLAAVGRASATALEEAGLSVDLKPDGKISGGEALAEAFPPGKGTVLLPGAAELAGTLQPGLAAKGWTLATVATYVTTATSSVDPVIARRWRNGDYLAFIATAPSIVRAAATLVGPTLPVVAIGQSSATAAQTCGFPLVIQAGSANPEDIVAAVLKPR